MDVVNQFVIAHQFKKAVGGDQIIRQVALADAIDPGPAFERHRADLGQKFGVVRPNPAQLARAPMHRRVGGHRKQRNAAFGGNKTMYGADFLGAGTIIFKMLRHGDNFLLVPFDTDHADRLNPQLPGRPIACADPWPPARPAFHHDNAAPPALLCSGHRPKQRNPLLVIHRFSASHPAKACPGAVEINMGTPSHEIINEVGFLCGEHIGKHIKDLH